MKFVMIIALIMILCLNNYLHGSELEKEPTEDNGIGSITKENKPESIILPRFAEEGDVGARRVKSEANSDSVRKIARAHGISTPIIFSDLLVKDVPLDGRYLLFNKKYDNTGIRINYIDRNFVVSENVGYTGFTHIDLEIRFNGNSCTNPGPLKYSKKVHFDTTNRIYPESDVSTFFGNCFDLPAGEYLIQVYLSLYADGIANGKNFFTVEIGGGYWCLEAEEVL